MGEPVVYADLTFLINLTMDFFILWAAARLAGIKIVYSRIIIASFLGGLYAVGYLLPGMSGWYSFPVKIAFSVLLIITAFWPQEWQELKSVFLYFYGISFAVAGATLAASYLFNHSRTTGFSYFWLLGGIGCALFIGIYGEKYLYKRVVPNLLHFNVRMRFDDDVCHGKGFLDTGNGLRDPLTNRPVVIAEYKLLQKLLPDDFRNAFETCSNETDLLEALTMTTWAYRLRLIPFTSIGRKNGLLIGVRADEVMVGCGKKNSLHQNLVVGIYRDNLSCEGNYQMLIPAEIL